MCPRGQRLINGGGTHFGRARLVSHCLLIETRAHGLVLVDTGIGVEDVRDTRRLGRFFGRAMAIDATKTRMPALAQVEALGFRREDVRHLVLTHLDFDHAGGLPDFPRATVHVHAKEMRAAMEGLSLKQRERYRKSQLVRTAAWETYDGVGNPGKGCPRCVSSRDSRPRSSRCRFPATHRDTRRSPLTLVAAGWSTAATPTFIAA